MQIETTRLIAKRQSNNNAWLAIRKNQRAHNA